MPALRTCDCGGKSARAALYCQWCGEQLRELEEFETRPDNTDADGCPCCGSLPAEVSWQTAPHQSVCGLDSCPVNTWDASPDSEAERPTDDDGYTARILTEPPENRERFSEWAGCSGFPGDIWELVGPDGEVVDRFEYGETEVSR